MTGTYVSHLYVMFCVIQALEERNYHIFYCMLAGVTAEEKATLSLGKAEEYRFLTKVLQ